MSATPISVLDLKKAVSSQQLSDEVGDQPK
jgi:hypothetical protein